MAQVLEQPRTQTVASPGTGALSPQEAPKSSREWTNLHRLCSSWMQMRESSLFTLIVHDCIENDLVALSYFLDHLGAMPAAVLKWAEGRSLPPAGMQRAVVEFLDKKAESLLHRTPSPGEATVIASYRRRLKSSAGSSSK